MGYIKNHAIIVTSYDNEAVEKAHKEAIKLFGEIVSNIRPSAINDHSSFAILPDGSKEGWAESDNHDDLRKQFREWTKTLDFEDGSNPLKWVEVWFDEEDEKGIVT